MKFDSDKKFNLKKNKEFNISVINIDSFQIQRYILNIIYCMKIINYDILQIVDIIS